MVDDAPYGGTKQVVMPRLLFERFEEWTTSQGWSIFPIPYSEGDLPTFGVDPLHSSRGA